MKKRLEFTAKEIVTEIRAKAKRDGKRKMSMADIQRDWSCQLTPYFIGQVFPDRADAIRVAGLYPTIPSDTDLVLSLWDFYLEKEQVPRAKDASCGVLPYSDHMYKRRLTDGGYWRDVLVAVKMISAADCKGQFDYECAPRVASEAAHEVVEIPPEIAEMYANRTRLEYYEHRSE